MTPGVTRQKFLPPWQSRGITYFIQSNKYPIFIVADGVTLKRDKEGNYPVPSDAFEAAKIKDQPEATLLGWSAYNAARFDQARRWNAPPDKEDQNSGDAPQGCYLFDKLRQHLGLDWRDMLRIGDIYTDIKFRGTRVSA